MRIDDNTVKISGEVIRTTRLKDMTGFLVRIRGKARLVLIAVLCMHKTIPIEVINDVKGGDTIAVEGQLSYFSGGGSKGEHNITALRLFKLHIKEWEPLCLVRS